ncbi:AMP-binding protein [Halomonas ramblicola]|uniref:AMP-binding protein n=1 Tax=Halomonas ramblicola TaxID=747349 RepID=UPI0025B28D80|nr:AMP-binding protein [Halomonas ramblicola]MDN3521807.1 AMP-binding protein [Halomonas ramblicola]
MYLPLTRLPWRHADPVAALPADRWCSPGNLAARIDAWRHWLDGRPEGRWLLHDSDPAGFCAALLALWESGRSAVLPGDDRPATHRRLAERVDGVLPVEAPASTAARSTPFPDTLDASREALVLYTSGSTGEPVMQAKRFDQLEAELDTHADLWPLDAAAVVSQVSHQHIYGLLTGLLHPLCHGVPFCGDVCRYPEVMAARLDEARRAGRRPTLVSSPAQLSRLPNHLTWDSPRRVFSSGAPLAAADALRVETLLDAPVIELYGSTETGGIAHRCQSRGDDWQPLPGVEIALADGGLALRSPYLEYPDRWWHQPDRVAATPHGFRLLGRADRLIKLAGKRVSLTAVERDLAALPEVGQARCVDLGRADERLGAVVAMPVDALPHDHEVRRRLIGRLRRHLTTTQAAVAVPRYWRFVSTLPTNAQGKLDGAMVARLFADLDDARRPRWLGEQWEGPDTCRLTLEVPERLAYLEGHFDDFPLVPGVVMVQWAIELAGEAFGPLGDFCGVERLKFQRVLRPGARFTLSLTRRAAGLAFTLDSRDGRHASGRVSLTGGDDG